MSTATRITTADDLLRIPDDGYRYELIEGELRKMTPAGSEHGFVTVEVTYQVAEFVKRKKLGCVFGAETGFRIAIDPDTVLAPDVSFVRRDRIEACGIPKEYFPEAPALVVEVVSPGDTVEDIDDKMRRWLSAGVEVAWVVHPGGRSVAAYRSLDDIRVLTANDVLDGGDVLPGFTVRVGDLFTALGN